MKFEVKIEKKEKSIILVKVKMPFAEVENKRDAVLKKLVENSEIEGFRKGKAPLSVVEKKIGEAKILQEASQETINEVFPDILKKEKLHIIGYPAISVTKLAVGNDFEFNVEMAIYPEVELPDYKKIAKSIKKVEKIITDEDVKKVEKNLLDMQNQMAHSTHKHKDGEECTEKEITELTDDFVKQIGGFENVADFKKKIKQDLEKENENKMISEHRGNIAEKILENIKLDTPEILVNAELDKILAQIKDDVQKAGKDFKEYLKSQNKNEIELRESFKKDGESRAKMEIVLKEIFKKEKIELDKEKLDEQIVNISKSYGEENLENIKLYVENIMINDAVMEFLEKQK